MLLHDASEAIYGDMATPIKNLMPDFRAIEDDCQNVMTHSFGLTPENTFIKKIEVKEIDKRIRIDERMEIMAEPTRTAGLKLDWQEDPGLKPIEAEIRCLLPRAARTEFLSCFVWCCENMPLRDPSIAHRIHRQIDMMADKIPGVRPVCAETTSDPFSLKENDYVDVENPSL
jgi:hypothetical protein